jgi:hypothetical protein
MGSLAMMTESDGRNWMSLGCLQAFFASSSSHRSLGDAFERERKLAQDWTWFQVVNRKKAIHVLLYCEVRTDPLSSSTPY